MATVATRRRLAANAGFQPGPGTDFRSGQETEIAKRLDQLAKNLGVVIYGISGARTPARSVAVGGSANDPHTQGAAADIGVGSMLRSSAGQLTDAQLASVGLYRPFGGATEINHVQLKPDSGGGLGGAIVQGFQSAIPGVGPLLGPAESVTGTAGDVIQGAESAASSAAKAVSVLTDPRTWIRVVEVIVGAALLLMGLKSFTGGTVDPIGAAAGAARRVA
jgi:hypothetical protein